VVYQWSEKREERSGMLDFRDKKQETRSESKFLKYPLLFLMSFLVHCSLYLVHFKFILHPSSFPQSFLFMKSVIKEYKCHEVFPPDMPWFLFG